MRPESNGCPINGGINPISIVCEAPNGLGEMLEELSLRTLGSGVRIPPAAPNPLKNRDFLASLWPGTPVADVCA